MQPLSDLNPEDQHTRPAELDAFFSDVALEERDPDLSANQTWADVKGHQEARSPLIK